MFLKRRKNMKGFRHPKKQSVTGVCHLCAAEFSLSPIGLFVLSACSCMTYMRAFCLRTSKLNHIYSEDKVVYTRMVLQVFLSLARKILSILHLYSFFVYLG